MARYRERDSHVSNSRGGTREHRYWIEIVSKGGDGGGSKGWRGTIKYKARRNGTSCLLVAFEGLLRNRVTIATLNQIPSLKIMKSYALNSHA